jgi:hypothetical protein
MTTEKKNAEIAKMIGLIPCKPPYKNAFVVDINKTHNPSFFYDLMEGEDWFVYPMFDSDANWQFEAISFIQKTYHYQINIYGYGACQITQFVNDDEKPNPHIMVMSDDRKEAIFEALYSFAIYLKNK